MDFVNIGSRTFALVAAYNEPSVAKAMPTMEKQFKARRQLIYFWDCETKSGLPNPRAANFAVRTQVGIQVFDPKTGKPDDAETKLTRMIIGQAVRIKKPKKKPKRPITVSDLVNKAIPPARVPIPYSMMDKYLDDFHIKMHVSYKPMFYMAHLMPKKGKGPPGDTTFLWLIMARDFEFEMKLISRCDGEEFDLGKDWDGTRAGRPLLDDIQQMRYEADKAGRNAAQKDKKKESGSTGSGEK